MRLVQGASCRLAVLLTEDLLGTACPMSHQRARRPMSHWIFCLSCRCRAFGMDVGLGDTWGQEIRLPKQVCLKTIVS